MVVQRGPQAPPVVNDEHREAQGVASRDLSSAPVGTTSLIVVQRETAGHALARSALADEPYWRELAWSDMVNMERPFH